MERNPSTSMITRISAGLLLTALMSGCGSPLAYHFKHYHGPFEAVARSNKTYFHSQQTGRIIEKDPCAGYREPPCYGYTPTSWAQWPEQCPGSCPVQGEDPLMQQLGDEYYGEVVVDETYVESHVPNSTAPIAPAPITPDEAAPTPAKLQNEAIPLIPTDLESAIPSPSDSTQKPFAKPIPLHIQPPTKAAPAKILTRDPAKTAATPKAEKPREKLVIRKVVPKKPLAVTGPKQVEAPAAKQVGPKFADSKPKASSRKTARIAPAFTNEPKESAKLASKPDAVEPSKIAQQIDRNASPNRLQPIKKQPAEVTPPKTEVAKKSTPKVRVEVEPTDTPELRIVAASPAQEIPPKKKVAQSKPSLVVDSKTKSLPRSAKKDNKSATEFSMKGLAMKKPAPKTRIAKVEAKPGTKGIATKRMATTQKRQTTVGQTSVAKKTVAPVKTRIARKPLPKKPTTSLASTKIVDKANPLGSAKVETMKVSDKPVSTLKFTKDSKRKPIRISAIPTGDSTTLRFR